MTEQEQRSEHSLSIFIDFENLALGFKDRRERFDITRVLKRLVEKGKIVSKKAYADWNRYHIYTEALHEAAIELIEIPRRIQSGKNSADIRLVVDAMDLSYSKEHIDTFVIVSGDSDFSPLVSKLKELGKHVIGLGMHDSTSELLRDNCDEFIYYEDLGEEFLEIPAMAAHVPEAKKKVFALLFEALLALRRENKEVMWSSMIKDTIKRKKPSFNETYHGYQTFSELLEDAAKEGLVEVEKHKRSGTYVVTRFGDEVRRAPRRRHDLDEMDIPEEGMERPRAQPRPERDPSRRGGPRRGGRRFDRPAPAERGDRRDRVESGTDRPEPVAREEIVELERIEPPVRPLREETPPERGEPLERRERGEPVERRERGERGGERTERGDRGGRGRGGRGRGPARSERPIRTYDVERELPPPLEMEPTGESRTAPPPSFAEPAAPPPPMMTPPPSPPVRQRSFGAGIFDE